MQVTCGWECIIIHSAQISSSQLYSVKCFPFAAVYLCIFKILVRVYCWYQTRCNNGTVFKYQKQGFHLRCLKDERGSKIKTLNRY